MLSEHAEEIIGCAPSLKGMVDHHTAIRTHHIASGVSIESGNIQHVYDVLIFIGNGNGIIFKSLIASVGLRAGENKHLGISGNSRVGDHVLSAPDLLLHALL